MRNDVLRILAERTPWARRCGPCSMRPILVTEGIPDGSPAFRSARELGVLFGGGRARPGDLVGRPIRGRSSVPPLHCGVLVGVDDVVHLTGVDGVRLETIESFAAGYMVHVVRRVDHPEACIARARAAIGTRRYNPVEWNCITFANWCALGS